jgi:hypothetical protein
MFKTLENDENFLATCLAMICGCIVAVALLVSMDEVATNNLKASVLVECLKSNPGNGEACHGITDKACK